MNRLSKGCFGNQFKGEKVSGFEFLHCGQIRSKEHFGHNAGWYNKKGEKIGWGDLDVKDIKSLMKTLQKDELFITLGEHDSFWKFVTAFNGPIGSMCATDKTEKEPGIDYIAEHARFIISHNEIFSNCNQFFEEPGTKQEIDGIEFTYLTMEEVKGLMLAF